MKVEIVIADISKLVTRTRYEEGFITTIQFDARSLHPASIARLLNLQRQGAPLLVTIGSPQATMDLIIQEDRGEQDQTEVSLFPFTSQNVEPRT